MTSLAPLSVSKKKPVCLSPRAKNALDQIVLARKTFVGNRQTTLEKAWKLIQCVGQNIELKLVPRENYGRWREDSDMYDTVYNRLKLRCGVPGQDHRDLLLIDSTSAQHP